MEAATAGAEVAERAVTDLAHSVPVLRALWEVYLKRLSKKQIEDMIAAGKWELHKGSKILHHQACKEALKRVGEYRGLKQTWVTAHQQAVEHDRELDSLKLFDVRRKSELYHAVREWEKVVKKFCLDAMTKSDWARLGLEFREGEVVQLSDSPSLHPSGAGLNSPSELTLAVPCGPSPLAQEITDVLNQLPEPDPTTWNPWLDAISGNCIADVVTSSHVSTYYPGQPLSCCGGNNGSDCPGPEDQEPEDDADGGDGT